MFVCLLYNDNRKMQGGLNILYNFNEFLNKNRHKLENCKYTYYMHQCEKILRKIFFKKDISEKEKDMLENETGLSLEEWKMLITDYNQENRFNCIEESFLDADNMPSAI